MNTENKLISILEYTESIIADTENITEILSEEYLDNQEFYIIRQNAENIQEIITKYDIDNNEELLSADIEEINAEMEAEAPPPMPEGGDGEVQQGQQPEPTPENPSAPPINGEVKQ